MLHVYDLHVGALNAVTSFFGAGGVYHAGLQVSAARPRPRGAPRDRAAPVRPRPEVYGVEWAYGATDFPGSGVCAGQSRGV